MKRKEFFNRIVPYIGKDIQLIITYDELREPITFNCSVVDAIVFVNLLPIKFRFDFIVL